MDTIRFNRFGAALSGLLLVIFTAASLHAEATRTQTVELRRGWNSVQLEVTPVNPDPSVIFAGTPVTLCAQFAAANSPVQFIQNPGNIEWKKDGWLVWYAPSRQDAFLANLFALDGNRAYLIYATADCTLNLAGTVSLEPTKWKADSFNFKGFGVDRQAPPSFAKYFASSAAHKNQKIFRLVNDQWTLVGNAATTPMRSGEACWYYCKGGSDYSGPLSVRLTAGQGVTFGDDAQTPVILANKTADPLAIRVQTVASDGGVPLGYVLRAISTNMMVSRTYDFPADYAPPTLEGGTTNGLWLNLRRERMTKSSQTALLKITTDLGTETWLPVTGTR